MGNTRDLFKKILSYQVNISYKDKHDKERKLWMVTAAMKL